MQHRTRLDGLFQRPYLALAKRIGSAAQLANDPRKEVLTQNKQGNSEPMNAAYFVVNGVYFIRAAGLFYLNFLVLVWHAVTSSSGRLRC